MVSFSQEAFLNY